MAVRLPSGGRRWALAVGPFSTRPGSASRLLDGRIRSRRSASPQGKAAINAKAYEGGREGAGRPVGEGARGPGHRREGRPPSNARRRYRRACWCWSIMRGMSAATEYVTSARPPAGQFSLSVDTEDPAPRQQRQLERLGRAPLQVTRDAPLACSLTCPGCDLGVRGPSARWSRRVAVREYGLRMIMCSRQRTMITSEGRDGQLARWCR